MAEEAHIGISGGRLRGESMAEKVAVSKLLLAGMTAGLFLLVLAIGFFIGRESVRRDRNPGPGSAETAVAPRPAPSEAAQLPATPSPESSVLEPPVRAIPAAGVDSAQPPPFPIKPGGSPSAVRPTDEPVRAAVAAYLAAIDQIQPGQMGGDASDVANKIVESLSSADTSGLDELIQRAESSRDRLSALSPPQPCTTHYQVSMACMDAGLQMLDSIKQAVAASDAEMLFSLPAQANAMLSCSDRLTQEDKTIRQRFLGD
jgi:hypothetical protein